jgi:poly(A) polymerase
MSAPPVEHLTPFPWMNEPGVTRVMAALGHENARFVGGAVRDSLLGRRFDEIDIATKLPPEAVMKRLGAAGIGTVPTGLAHGTVTAVPPERHIEITTLRRDVATDGRHAKIEQTDDWAEDARRRDFTMNALYLDLAGNLYDPGGGLGDLRAGRVRFVGDAATRIDEDVLRLLRFYRFVAHYDRGVPDADARAACRDRARLLPNLSAERVQAELFKLLLAPDPLPALDLMGEDGVLAMVLPEAKRFDRLKRLVDMVNATRTQPDSVRRLAALVAVDKSGATRLAERLRLSNQAKARLEILAAPNWPIDLDGSEKRQRRALYHLGRDAFRDLVWMSGDVARAPRLLSLADSLEVPVFPVKGGDVAALGVPPGPEIGRLLAALEAWWEAEDFGPSRDACLVELKNWLKAGAP